MTFPIFSLGVKSASLYGVELYRNFKLTNHFETATQIFEADGVQVLMDTSKSHLFYAGRNRAEQFIRGEKENTQKWHAWQVDLSRFKGRAVNIELQTNKNETTYYDGAYWGSRQLCIGKAFSHAAELTQSNTELS